MDRIRITPRVTTDRACIMHRLTTNSLDHVCTDHGQSVSCIDSLDLVYSDHGQSVSCIDRVWITSTLTMDRVCMMHRQSLDHVYTDHEQSLYDA